MIDLKIRPIYHRLDQRIRTHVLLCMLAYYVQWHMRKKLAPILFDDHERAQAERDRKSIVAAASRSKAAARKDQSKRTHDDEPVHSFRTLLEDLGTLAKNRVRVRGSSQEFYVLTQPTPCKPERCTCSAFPTRRSQKTRSPNSPNQLNQKALSGLWKKSPD